MPTGPRNTPLRTLAALAVGLLLVLPLTALAGSAPASAQEEGTLVTRIRYSADGGRTYRDNITVAPGATFTIALQYGNAFPTTLDQASVRSALPAGFTLVPGSTRECPLFTGGSCVPVVESAGWTGADLLIAPDTTFSGPVSASSTPLPPELFGDVEFQVVAPSVDGVHTQHVELSGLVGGVPTSIADDATITVRAAGVPLVDPVAGAALLTGLTTLGAIAHWRRRHTLPPA
jgi:hypothetical protein